MSLEVESQEEEVLLRSEGAPVASRVSKWPRFGIVLSVSALLALGSRTAWHRLKFSEDGIIGAIEEFHNCHVAGSSCKAAYSDCFEKDASWAQCKTKCTDRDRKPCSAGSDSTLAITTAPGDCALSRCCATAGAECWIAKETKGHLVVKYRCLAAAMITEAKKLSKDIQTKALADANTPTLKTAAKNYWEEASSACSRGVGTDCSTTKCCNENQHCVFKHVGQNHECQASDPTGDDKYDDVTLSGGKGWSCKVLSPAHTGNDCLTSESCYTASDKCMKGLEGGVMKAKCVGSGKVGEQKLQGWTEYPAKVMCDNSFVCPANRKPHLRHSACSGLTCTEDECCDKANTCPMNAATGQPSFNCGGIQNAQRRGTVVCQGAQCTQLDCCLVATCGLPGLANHNPDDLTALPQCPLNRKGKPTNSDCPSGVCTLDDCCEPATTCGSHVKCPDQRVPKPSTTICAAYSCKENDCCLPVKTCTNFACPIEKTGSPAKPRTPAGSIECKGVGGCDVFTCCEVASCGPAPTCPSNRDPIPMAQADVCKALGVDHPCDVEDCCTKAATCGLTFSCPTGRSRLHHSSVCLGKVCNDVDCCQAATVTTPAAVETIPIATTTTEVHTPAASVHTPAASLATPVAAVATPTEASATPATAVVATPATAVVATPAAEVVASPVNVVPGTAGTAPLTVASTKVESTVVFNHIDYDKIKALPGVEEQIKAAMRNTFAKIWRVDASKITVSIFETGSLVTKAEYSALTPAEKQVMDSLIRDYGSRAIADELVVAVKQIDQVDQISDGQISVFVTEPDGTKTHDADTALAWNTWRSNPTDFATPYGSDYTTHHRRRNHEHHHHHHHHERRRRRRV